MEDAIVDALQDMQYSAVSNKDKLESVINDPLSVEFSKLVEWLTIELGKHVGLEEHACAISGTDGIENFLMELNGFLREYGGCVHSTLLEGPLNERLDTREKKILLLDFLISELQAVRLIASEKPHLLPKTPKQEQKELSPATMLKDLLTTLGFPKPPDGINFFQIFSKVENKIKDNVSKIEAAHMSKPLLKATLSEKQWDHISYMNQALKLEYELRRTMLLDRLDVTILSFKWAKKNEDKITEVYNKYRDRLNKPYDIAISNILACREDLLKVEKTSSGMSRERTKCSINRHIIGKVPDRGGRVNEHEPPPPEMPAFQQRQQQPASHQHRGGKRTGAAQNVECSKRRHIET